MVRVHTPDHSAVRSASSLWMRCSRLQAGLIRLKAECIDRNSVFAWALSFVEGAQWQA